MPSPTARSGQLLEQAIDVLQSQNLVLTTVCVVISTVASLRRLVPKDCFRVHYYDIENPNCSYEDFMNPTEDDLTIETRLLKNDSDKYIPWGILVRGKDKGADKLLDWIELGLADALSQKYLATMQLSIYDSETSPPTKLEAHVIIFTYTELGVEMILQRSGGSGLPFLPRMTIGSTKEKLRYLVHCLTLNIGGFPRVPPHSIVNMHFTYNNTCPQSYEPPGFIACKGKDEALVLRDNEGASVGEIHLGPHSVELRVSIRERFQSPLAGMTTHGRPLPIATLHSPINVQTTHVRLSPHVNKAAVRENAQPNSERDLQNVDQKYSQLSNVSTVLDTQQREQLADIDCMARFRYPQLDPNDTQLLGMVNPTGDDRIGSIDIDGESTMMDASSTQGTPSTVCGRRSARLAMKSTANTQGKSLIIVLKNRERQSTPHTERFSSRICKRSNARSPFINTQCKR